MSDAEDVSADMGETSRAYSPPHRGQRRYKCIECRGHCRIGKASTCSGRDLFVVSNT